MEFYIILADQFYAINPQNLSVHVEVMLYNIRAGCAIHINYPGISIV